MADTTKDVITIDDKKGQSLSVVGDTYRTIISGKQTGGSYAVIDMLIPPGGGPGPHAHADMQESFYVLDGEIEFKTEKGSYVARKGSFVYIPLGGAVHSFTNTTEKISHLVCTVIPAGIAEFFEEIGKPIDADTFLPHPVLSAEEKDRLKSIAEKYGQKLYPPDYLG